jgi:hypothetical protein
MTTQRQRDRAHQRSLRREAPDLDALAWRPAYPRITCEGVRRNFYNSLIMTIPATLVSAMLGAVNDYISSKSRFRGSEFLFTCVTLGVFMPGQVAPASGESFSRSCCYMRSEIKKLHSKVGKITVYLTHDQIEAMTLATRTRRHPAVRRTGNRLRPAHQHVRRRLHAQPVDEFRARDSG